MPQGTTWLCTCMYSSGEDENVENNHFACVQTAPMSTVTEKLYVHTKLAEYFGICYCTAH